jgi:glycosyltransferase involved in cell wall biosynthesis
VRAAALILKQFPKTEFLIIGQDAAAQKDYRKQLEKLIEELGLQNKIHFLGWFTDIAPILSILDVLVSASYIESFGLAIAEATASACAVVATETEGAKEIIEKNRTGKLVPIGNAEALAVAVGEFLENEAMRKAFGVKAQEIAKEKFDIKKMIEETERVYREIR